MATSEEIRARRKSIREARRAIRMGRPEEVVVNVVQPPVTEANPNVLRGEDPVERGRRAAEAAAAQNRTAARTQNPATPFDAQYAGKPPGSRVDIPAREYIQGMKEFEQNRQKLWWEDPNRPTPYLGSGTEALKTLPTKYKYVPEGPLNTRLAGSETGNQRLDASGGIVTAEALKPSSAVTSVSQDEWNSMSPASRAGVLRNRTLAPSARQFATMDERYAAQGIEPPKAGKHGVIDNLTGFAGELWGKGKALARNVGGFVQDAYQANDPAYFTAPAQKSSNAFVRGVADTGAAATRALTAGSQAAGSAVGRFVGENILPPVTAVTESVSNYARGGRFAPNSSNPNFYTPEVFKDAEGNLDANKIARLRGATRPVAPSASPPGTLRISDLRNFNLGYGPAAGGDATKPSNPLAGIALGGAPQPATTTTAPTTTAASATTPQGRTLYKNADGTQVSDKPFEGSTPFTIDIGKPAEAPAASEQTSGIQAPTGAPLYDNTDPFALRSRNTAATNDITQRYGYANMPASDRYRPVPYNRRQINQLAGAASGGDVLRSMAEINRQAQKSFDRDLRRGLSVNAARTRADYIRNQAEDILGYDRNQAYREAAYLDAAASSERARATQSVAAADLEKEARKANNEWIQNLATTTDKDGKEIVDYDGLALAGDLLGIDPRDQTMMTKNASAVRGILAFRQEYKNKVGFLPDAQEMERIWSSAAQASNLEWGDAFKQGDINLLNVLMSNIGFGPNALRVGEDVAVKYDPRHFPRGTLDRFRSRDPDR